MREKLKHDTDRLQQEMRSEPWEHGVLEPVGKRTRDHRQGTGEPERRAASSHPALSNYFPALLDGEQRRLH